MIPVAHRATHRLIRQLDLALGADAIGDEAIKRYTKMYKTPIPKKVLEAISTATHLSSDSACALISGLGNEELAVQVEVEGA